MVEITGRDDQIIREALSIAVPIMLRHSLAASNTDDMIRILEERYNGPLGSIFSNTRIVGDILLELKAGERPKADPRTDTMGWLIKRFIKKIPKPEFDYLQRFGSPPPEFRKDIDIGLIGEIDVRRELAAEEWLTINTNTEKGNFPNVDLIAAKDQEARHIQVKSTSGKTGQSHAHCLNFGRAQGWLEKKHHFSMISAGF
jgi:hypothetical protein